MNKIIISIFTLLLVAVGTSAQVVTGTVTDDLGPVIGAAVMVEGTTIGATTDLDGNFSINVPNAKTAVLVVRYVGMNEIKEPLKGRTSGILIKMTVGRCGCDRLWHSKEGKFDRCNCQCVRKGIGEGSDSFSG